MDETTFLIELSESGRTDFGIRDFSTQSDAQKVFSALWALESEVNNGGFHQYFFNSNGDTANYAPTALRQVGAVKCAEIVERALRVVSSSPLPDDWPSRQQLMLALDEDVITELEAVDAEFYAYPDNLGSLLFDFVRSHQADFGPMPT